MVIYMYCHSVIGEAGAWSPFPAYIRTLDNAADNKTFGST